MGRAWLGIAGVAAGAAAAWLLVAPGGGPVGSLTAAPDLTARDVAPLFEGEGSAAPPAGPGPVAAPPRRAAAPAPAPDAPTATLMGESDRAPVPPSPADLASLVARLSDADGRVRHQAGDALANAGADGLAALVAALRAESPLARLAAAGAVLRRLGELNTESGRPVVDATLRAILGWLQDADAEVRAAGAEALGMLGPHAEAAIPTLGAVLGAEEYETRAEAARALGRIGPRGALASAPLLVAALGDPSAAVRLEVVRALALLGPEGRGALARLAPMVGDDDDPEVGAAAAAAIGAMGIEGAPAIPLLVEGLTDSDDDVRGAAALALAGIGGPAREHIAAIAALLTDDAWPVRAAAARALGAFGADARTALEALRPLAGDLDFDVRLAVVEALGRIEGGEPPGRVDDPGGRVRALRRGLTSPDAAARSTAALALGRLGPTAADALAALVGALDDPDARVRRCAATGLGGLGAAAVLPLAAALRHPDGTVQDEAAQALERMGPAAADAVPTLAAIVREAKPQSFGGSYARRALAAIGTAALPALVECLRQERLTQWEFRMIPADARPEAARLVLPLLDARDVTVVMAACGALGVLGADAELALARLRALAAATDNAGVRTSAHAAIRDIGRRG